jgi:hypothetical protein
VYVQLDTGHHGYPYLEKTKAATSLFFNLLNAIASILQLQLPDFLADSYANETNLLIRQTSHHYQPLYTRKARQMTHGPNSDSTLYLDASTQP